MEPTASFQRREEQLAALYKHNYRLSLALDKAEEDVDRKNAGSALQTTQIWE